MFEIREVDLAGRIGKLYVPSGTVIETPAFFPVIDFDRQELPLEDIWRAGFRQIITNAYLLLRRYGRRVVERGGIHKFLGWQGAVMTDSGAYQILEYGDIKASQQDIIEYEKAIGSDIAVILDVPTGDTTRDKAEETVRETLRRAREALELIRGSTNLWVLPIQGGKYRNLVKYSARMARELTGYSIYAIGSPTVHLERYEYPVVLRTVAAAKEELPWGKPIHLFGAGHPLLIPYAVALGVDMFDSASYILYARDSRVFTDYGVERLEHLDTLVNPCKGYIDARDLLEAPQPERTRELAFHNLCMIRKYLDDTKRAIREGRLYELLEALSRHHPSTYSALKAVIEHREMLLRSSPRVRGVVRGVRVFGEESIHNPKIAYYRRRVLGRRYKPRVGGATTILVVPLPRDIDNCDPYPRGDTYILYYHPHIGPVPQELCGVYPTVQTNYPEPPLPTDVADSLARDLAEYILWLSSVTGARVVLADNDPWNLLEKIRGAIQSGQAPL